MKLTAINAIERGADANPSRVQPGSVWDATEQEQVDLIAMRAARQATDEEVAAFDARNPGTVTAAVATPTPSSRDLLETRAKELGIEFRPNVSDKTLAERVAEAEAKAKADADAAAAKAAADAANDGETLI